MIYTIAAIFLVLWLVGVIGGYAFGGLVHLLLLAAVVMFLLRIIQGRNPIR
jgi:hypothetical protein